MRPYFFASYDKDNGVLYRLRTLKPNIVVKVVAGSIFGVIAGLLTAKNIVTGVKYIIVKSPTIEKAVDLSRDWHGDTTGDIYTTQVAMLTAMTTIAVGIAISALIRRWRSRDDRDDER